LSDNRHLIGFRDYRAGRVGGEGAYAAMQPAEHTQQINETSPDHRISADDRILLDYWRAQLVATMLSGDEDASVHAKLMLHKLIAKYQKRGDHHQER